MHPDMSPRKSCLDASKKFFSLGSFSEKKFSNKNSFRDESRLVFSGSNLVENKPRMQKQPISADLGRIRDKPKVGHFGLVRGQERQKYGETVRS